MTSTTEETGAALGEIFKRDARAGSEFRERGGKHYWMSLSAAVVARRSLQPMWGSDTRRSPIG